MAASYFLVVSCLMSDVEVVIVLGKGILPNGTLPSTVRHELDYALRLNKPIICSGGQWGLSLKPSHLAEATVMTNYLQHPALLETQSKDTIGNLLLSKQLVDQYGWKTIEIVSSVEHMARVQVIAERVFHHGYHLQYHGHDHLMTAGQYLHSRRYELLAKLYDRWILRKLPEQVDHPLQWLEEHHFMYSENSLLHLAKTLANRPAHR